jgi:hypothetical protein
LKDAQARLTEIMQQSASGATLPLWRYTIVDGTNSYPGVMVGRNPFSRGHRTTTVQAYLVPVILTFSDGTVLDPTKPDPCISNNIVTDLVQNSPIFQNASYTMNGADVGDTQYIDAFQRANFWSDVSGTPYHTLLSLTVLPAQSKTSVTVPAAVGYVKPGQCGNYGSINYDWWDTYLQKTMIPSLALDGVGPSTLPVFVFDSVVIVGGKYGYHNSYYDASSNVQTYVVTDFDASQSLGTSFEDVSLLSHEVGEWMNDPLGANLTPSWGNIGQVYPFKCQTDLEVGDPLTGTLLPEVTLNGFNYHLQELAFFSWFYGQAPSLGAGGKYSDNGKFSGYAKPCLLGIGGGTN